MVNDRAAYRVAADLDPFETKAAAGAIRESMAIFIVVGCFVNKMKLSDDYQCYEWIWIWYPFHGGSVRTRCAPQVVYRSS